MGNYVCMEIKCTHLLSRPPQKKKKNCTHLIEVYKPILIENIVTLESCSKTQAISTRVKLAV